MEKNELNLYDINLLDLYMLNYCGVIVVFQVCKTKEKSVCVYELATKKYKDGISLCKNMSASKEPYFISKYDNTFNKSQYEVYPIMLDGFDEYLLPLKVDLFDKIYQKATEYVDYPPVGYVYAFPLKNFRDVYWVQDLVKKEPVKFYC